VFKIEINSDGTDNDAGRKTCFCWQNVYSAEIEKCIVEHLLDCITESLVKIILQQFKKC